LTIIGPTGIRQVVYAGIDTGFTGAVVLPKATVSSLGLIRRSGGTASLADGSTCNNDNFCAEVEWHGGTYTFSNRSAPKATSRFVENVGPRICGCWSMKRAEIACSRPGTLWRIAVVTVCLAMSMGRFLDAEQMDCIPNA
jgi:hypothetical protein